MIINTQLTYQDYMMVNRLVNNRKPAVTATYIIGFILLLMPAAYFSALGFQLLNGQIFLIRFLAIWLIIFKPYLVNLVTRAAYRTNLRLQEEIVYDLTDEKIIMTGKTFNQRLTWEKMYRIEELKKYFLVYRSYATFDIIPKKSMTAEEINDTRIFFKNLHINGAKKLMF